MKEPESLPISAKLHPEIENLCFKLKEMLMESKSKMQDSALFEGNLNKIFEELSYKYDK